MDQLREHRGRVRLQAGPRQSSEGWPVEFGGLTPAGLHLASATASAAAAGAASVEVPSAELTCALSPSLSERAASTLVAAVSAADWETPALAALSLIPVTILSLLPAAASTALSTLACAQGGGGGVERAAQQASVRGRARGGVQGGGGSRRPQGERLNGLLRPKLAAQSSRRALSRCPRCGAPTNGYTFLMRALRDAAQAVPLLLRPCMHAEAAPLQRDGKTQWLADGAGANSPL